jgi:phospholipase/carboxylesterase
MLAAELIPAARADSRQLLVVLHGLGDSREGYRWLPGALAMPELHYLLVNAPEDYGGGYSWFDVGESLADPAGVARSRALLFNLLEHQERLGFPATRTFVLGFSQGCLMAWETGFRYPKRLGGLVGLSGWACEPERLLAEQSSVARQQRFLITHGTLDPLIPFDAVQGQIELFKAAGLNIAWQPLVKAHQIAGEAELALVRGFLQAGPARD